MSSVVDQTLDAEVQPLTIEAINEMYKGYKAKYGDVPSPESEPMGTDPVEGQPVHRLCRVRTQWAQIAARADIPSHFLELARGVATEGDAWTARLRGLVPDLLLRVDDLLVVGVCLCGKDGRVH